MSETLASDESDTSLIVLRGRSSRTQLKTIKRTASAEGNNPQVLWVAQYDNKTPHLVVMLDEARNLGFL